MMEKIVGNLPRRDYVEEIYSSHNPVSDNEPPKTSISPYQELQSQSMPRRHVNGEECAHRPEAEQHGPPIQLHA